MTSRTRLGGCCLQFRGDLLAGNTKKTAFGGGKFGYFYRTPMAAYPMGAKRRNLRRAQRAGPCALIP